MMMMVGARGDVTLAGARRCDRLAGARSTAVYGLFLSMIRTSVVNGAAFKVAGPKLSCWLRQQFSGPWTTSESRLGLVWKWCRRATPRQGGRAHAFV